MLGELQLSRAEALGKLNKLRYRFDVIELSAGFLSFPGGDWVRLVEEVQSHGLKAKPELGIQFGAGGGEHLMLSD